jgi:hypothetical protein
MHNDLIAMHVLTLRRLLTRALSCPISVQAPPVAVVNAQSFTAKSGIGATIDASGSKCATTPCIVEVRGGGARRQIAKRAVRLTIQSRRASSRFRRV